jgi:hypothetical protein
MQDQLKNNSAFSVFHPPITGSFESRAGWRHSFIAGTVTHASFLRLAISDCAGADAARCDRQHEQRRRPHAHRLAGVRLLQVATLRHAPPLMMIASHWLHSYSGHLTSCFSLTWRLAAALNGVDEVLDLGDDCHEVNLLSRAKLMGVGAWNLGNVAVELVEHHKWQRSHLWTRFLSSSRCAAFAIILSSRPCRQPS